MFDKLFGNSKKPDNSNAKPAHDETHLALAALLVEAACADEEYTDIEKQLISAALAAQFSLDETGANALRAAAETVQEEAIDIHRFTRVAKAISQDDKFKLIENLWEIVLSDGARDQFEDALIRRICGLIYVDDKDSGAIRRRVAERRKG